MQCHFLHPSICPCTIQNETYQSIIEWSIKVHWNVYHTRSFGRCGHGVLRAPRLPLCRLDKSFQAPSPPRCWLEQPSSARLWLPNALDSRAFGPFGLSHNNFKRQCCHGVFRAPLLPWSRLEQSLQAPLPPRCGLEQPF